MKKLNTSHKPALNADFKSIIKNIHVSIFFLTSSVHTAIKG